MLPFWASRCFRSEALRVLLALAARTASVLVGCCFGCGVFAAFPAVGIIGSPYVGVIAPRPKGCIVMGPTDFGLLLRILSTTSGSVTIDMERRPFRAAFIVMTLTGRGVGDRLRHGTRFPADRRSHCAWHTRHRDGSRYRMHTPRGTGLSQ
jgi:hypothetical protein